MEEKIKELSKEELEAIKLAKFYYEKVKPFYEKLDENTKALIEKFGIGHYFQDPKGGQVFKVDEQTCFTVFNKPFVVKRTRYEGERQGSLGMKEAREAGYWVEGQPPLEKK